MQHQSKINRRILHFYQPWWNFGSHLLITESSSQISLWLKSDLGQATWACELHELFGKPKFSCVSSWSSLCTLYISYVLPVVNMTTNLLFCVHLSPAENVTFVFVLCCWWLQQLIWIRDHHKAKFGRNNTLRTTFLLSYLLQFHSAIQKINCLSKWRMAGFWWKWETYTWQVCSWYGQSETDERKGWITRKTTCYSQHLNRHHAADWRSW